MAFVPRFAVDCLVVANGCRAFAHLASGTRVVVVMVRGPLVSWSRDSGWGLALPNLQSLASLLAAVPFSLPHIFPDLVPLCPTTSPLTRPRLC